LSPDMYGIYIPEPEILLRPKYQWFAVLDIHQLLKSNIFIAKHIKASMVDASGIYDETSEVKSTVIGI